jgi:hypothetical protein
MLTNILFFCKQKNIEKIITPRFHQMIHREYRNQPNTNRHQCRSAESPRHKKAGSMHRNRLAEI